MEDKTTIALNAMSSIPLTVVGSQSGSRMVLRQSSGWLAVTTVMVYIVFSTTYLAGSLMVGDIWLAGAMVLALFFRQSRNGLVRFFRSGYFLLSSSILSVMLIVTFNAASALENVKFIVQFMTILWVLIPLVAVGISQMDSPFLFLETSSWLYLIIFFLGVILQFGFGIDWILFNAGPDRYYIRFNYHAVQMMALCLATACLFKDSQIRWRYLAMLLGVLVMVIFSASRTGIVSIAVVIGMAGLMSLRHRYGLLLSIVSVIGTTWFLFFSAVQDKVGIATRTEFFEDEVRLDSIIAAWQTLKQDWMNWLFGVGWGNSGKGASLEIVVHNVLLQVLTEAGIVTLLLICCLLFIPLIWVRRLKNTNKLERTFVVLGCANVWIFWLFNALSCERIYWLGFAVVMGMAYRIRIAGYSGKS